MIGCWLPYISDGTAAESIGLQFTVPTHPFDFTKKMHSMTFFLFAFFIAGSLSKPTELGFSAPYEGGKLQLPKHANETGMDDHGYCCIVCNSWLSCCKSPDSCCETDHCGQCCY
ncbi:hypothetical protein AAVH_37750 [Aphelenchoides avenae]|nr:hypothetical protein AAVH_37750 [Aphelenchus avenae]